MTDFKKKNNRIRNIIITVLVTGIIVGSLTCYYVWDITKDYYEENPVILETVITKTLPGKTEVVEKEVTISGATIKEGFNEIGTLNTSEYFYTHVAKYSSNVELFCHEVPFSESSYIYSYDGRVCAGMDFSDIEVEVDDFSRVIIITLPAIEITGFEIDTDSFKLYDESISFINRLSIETMADTLSEIEAEETQNAIERGILDRAEENAELLVRNFMDGLYEANGYSVEIHHTKSPQGN